MKILMIGLGSIGQRHLRNIKKLYGENVEILAYRVRGLQRTFSDDMSIREAVQLEEEYRIKSFSDLGLALAEKPEAAFITNITSEHVNCAIKALEAGCDVFLEKPVSHTLEGARRLYDTMQRENKIVFVGFQNRYHKCLLRLRRLLSENAVGQIISADVEMGECLASMHPYETYGDTYMARKDMGGGGDI